MSITHTRVILLLDEPKLLERIGRSVVRFIDEQCIRTGYLPEDDVMEVPLDHCDLLSRVMESIETHAKAVPQERIDSACPDCLYFDGNRKERNPCKTHQPRGI